MPLDIREANGMRELLACRSACEKRQRVGVGVSALLSTCRMIPFQGSWQPPKIVRTPPLDIMLTQGHGKEFSDTFATIRGL